MEDISLTFLFTMIVVLVTTVLIVCHFTRQRRARDRSPENQAEPHSLLLTSAETAKKSNSIHAIIELFNSQRQKGYQFAVLFVSSGSKQDILDSETSPVQFQTKDGVVDSPDKATDSSHPTFPPDNKILKLHRGKTCF